MLRVSKDLRSRIHRVPHVTRVSQDDPRASLPASGLHLVMIPPGMRGIPHVHTGQETALFMVSGEAEVWYGAGLARRCTVRAGDFLYLPPGTPHLAVNQTDIISIAVAASADATADGARGDTTPVELPRHLAGLEGLPVAGRQ
jgi:uncharacterized RmlC-like cupin family protein